MAQNQRSVSAGGKPVPEKLILEPKDVFDKKIPNAYDDRLLENWWWSPVPATYDELVLRERIKILEDCGMPVEGLKTELLAILLAK